MLGSLCRSHLSNTVRDALAAHSKMPALLYGVQVAHLKAILSSSHVCTGTTYFIVLLGGLQILHRQTPCSHSLPVSACFSRFAACIIGRGSSLLCPREERPWRLHATESTTGQQRGDMTFYATLPFCPAIAISDLSCAVPLAHASPQHVSSGLHRFRGCSIQMCSLRYAND